MCVCFVENAGIIEDFVDNEGIMRVYWPKYWNLRVNPHLWGYCGNTADVSEDIIKRKMEGCKAKHDVPKDEEDITVLIEEEQDQLSQPCKANWW